LLLEKDPGLVVGLGWVLKDCCDPNAINVRAFGSSETLAGLPRALDAFGICVGGPTTRLTLMNERALLKADVFADAQVKHWSSTYLTNVAHFASLLSRGSVLRILDLLDALVDEAIAGDGGVLTRFVGVIGVT